MKTKEIIQNEYAVSKGFSSWHELTLMFNYMNIFDTQNHINAVTDLIQKELLNRVAKDKHPFTESILNTPIL